MAEDYRKLPFVQGVENNYEESGLLQLKFKNGGELTVDISLLSEDSIDTLEKVKECLVYQRARIEEQLKKGDCIFFLSSGNEISFGERKAAQDLQAVVDVLRSPLPATDKIARLQQLRFLPSGNPESFSAMVTGFQASAQLDERIKELRQRTGLGSKGND